MSASLSTGSPTDSEQLPTVTRQEKIEFLKQSVTTTEGHVRAYDTKAQIVLAAFVLSWNPLWAILSTSCDHAARSNAVMVLTILVISTIVAYGFVVWPVKLAPAASGVESKSGMFFISEDFAGGAQEYLRKLQSLVTEEELANEVLKLAYIREVKGRRFKWALCVTVLTYLDYVVTFVMLRQG